MPRSRTSSPDLHLDLTLDDRRGRRAALERALRDAVRDGRLAPGTVLPSTRALAEDLHLSRGTVVDAYGQLVAEGYLHAKPGSATEVADTVGSPPPLPVEPPPKRPRIDLRPGLLDIGSTFPRDEWVRATRAVLRVAPDESLDYGDPRGSRELRTALAGYLARARGVVTTPECIVVCAGFAHGFAVLLRALHRGGAHTIAMEDPCLPTHRQIVADQGLQVAAAPVDEDGVCVGAVERSGVDAALVTAAHQYPMGATLSPARRLQLVGWAQQADTLVIEDDYDGEFRYDRQPVGAVQGLAPDHVVYVGTTSKTIAPGVRVGWLVLPPRLVEPVVEANRHGAATPPALTQLTIAQLIDQGHLDRHLRRLRLGYRRRRDILLTELDAVAPTASLSGVAAGLHVVVGLDGARLTEDRVRAAAERHAIALAYLGSHWHAAPRLPEHGIIVGYARTPIAAFRDVASDLAGVLKAASAS